jgi:hypothetical protein
VLIATLYSRFAGFRTAFGPYSGLAAVAGFALMIVFGSSYIRQRSALEGMSAETAIKAVVSGVREITCSRSMSTSIQSFNVKLRCLEVKFVPGETPQGAGREEAPASVLVEQAGIGSLKAGDKVFVVPANTGIDRYMIVNASDSGKFFSARDSALGGMLLGALVVLLSWLIKRSQPDESET